MSISKKIKTTNNKIEQNKAQFNLDRQTAKISALSSGNVSKREFLTGKDVNLFTRKRLARKSCCNELKAQTDIAKKQYQKLDDTYDFDRIIKKRKATI